MNRKQRKAKIISARKHSGFYKKSVIRFIRGQVYTLSNPRYADMYRSYNLYLGIKLECLGCGVFASQQVCGHDAMSAGIHVPDKFKRHCIHLPPEAFVRRK